MTSNPQKDLFYREACEKALRTFLKVLSILVGYHYRIKKFFKSLLHKILTQIAEKLYLNCYL